MRRAQIDLYDFINHATLGSPNTDYRGKSGSSSWGWFDPESGREFIASGVFDGVSFIEVLPEGRMLHVGFIPKYAPLADRAYWTEIRPYKHYMVIGSELEGNGVQIFDMTKLLDLKPEELPKLFSNEEDLTGHWTEGLPIGSAHNVVVNEEGNYGVAVGARPRDQGCKGGLQFFSLDDPSNPVTLGCNGDDGYVHDAQCVIYRGPHEKYQGKDICYGFNEDTVTIYDVTNKANSTIISRTSYVGAAYTHQGWLNDPKWQEFLFVDDEYDEYDVTEPALDGYPVTYIWDIRDLENPKQVGQYKGTVRSIDHNQYIHGDYIYQSNYGAGMRVYDISSVPEDPTGNSVCEVAFFDIYPEDDKLPGGGTLEFLGSWSSYAMLPSGFIFINTIERGGYLVKLTKHEHCKPKTCNADNCLRSLRAESIEGRLEESQVFCAGYLDGWEADVASVPSYARKACPTNVISRVSSACSCLPTATPTA
jgi:choice-of-anchor B domain-containing protein